MKPRIVGAVSEQAIKAFLVSGLVAMLMAFSLLGWISVKSTLLPLVGVVLCFLMGHFAPRSAVSAALAAPFAPGLPYVSTLGSQAENIGTLLALAVILRVSGRACGVSRQTATRLLAPFVVLTLVILVILPHGSGSASSLGQAMMHAGAVSVAVCLMQLDLAHLVRIMAASSCAVSLLALSTPELLVDRSTDVVGGLNANGVGVIAAIGFVAATIGLTEDSWWWRPVHLGVGVACALGISVSQSRGAYLDVAIALLVAFSYRLIKRPTLTGRLALLSLFAFALYLGPIIVRWAGLMTGRFSEAQAESESLATRFDAARYSVEVGLGHPLWGVGISNLADFSSQNQGAASVRSHIVYLGVLGEAGLVSASLLAILATHAFLRSRRAGAQPLALCASVIVAGFSVNWWPASGTGAVCLAVLAWSASAQAPSLAQEGGGASPENELESLLEDSSRSTSRGHK